MNAETPSIARFKALEGVEKARALVVLLVSQIVENINVGKNMNDSQIALMTDLILKEYYYLKPEDFIVFRDRVLLGKYGRSYDRLDIQIISDWLNQYIIERAGEAVILDHNERYMNNENLKTITREQYEKTKSNKDTT